jgi:hypothetical protein
MSYTQYICVYLLTSQQLRAFSCEGPHDGGKRHCSSLVDICACQATPHLWESQVYEYEEKWALTTALGFILSL